MAKGVCVHCKERPANRGRGLCFRCHQSASIRNQYPRKVGDYDRDDMTEEELEAMIAEQMANLPKWWPQSGTWQDGRDSDAERKRQKRRRVK